MLAVDCILLTVDCMMLAMCRGSWVYLVVLVWLVSVPVIFPVVSDLPEKSHILCILRHISTPLVPPAVELQAAHHNPIDPSRWGVSLPTLSVFWRRSPSGMSALDNYSVDAVYGRLYGDAEDGCLLVRSLSSGQSCRAQLVYSVGTGAVCVRKALRPPFPDDVQNIADQAAQEFDRDVLIAKRLAAAAVEGDYETRISALLSAPHPNAASRVSYWELCNGGTLFAFFSDCLASRVVLPLGLALHILLQLLEALDFMYTGPGYPIFHRDLHECNIMLNFAPGHAMPDIHILDFGRAISTAPEDSHTQPEGGATLGWWDIKGVIDMIHESLAALTLPMEKRCQLASQNRKYGGMYGFLHQQPSNNHPSHPLCQVVKMLEDAHHSFAKRMIVAIQRAKVTGQNPQPFRPPSLRPTINFLQGITGAHLQDAEVDEEHAAFRRNVLAPAREKARAIMAMRPKLCRTVNGLLEWLGDAGEPGPWDVAQVEPDDPTFKVCKTLLNQTRGRERVESWERNTSDEEDSDYDPGQGLW